MFNKRKRIKFNIISLLQKQEYYLRCGQYVKLYNIGDDNASIALRFEKDEVVLIINPDNFGKDCSVNQMVKWKENAPIENRLLRGQNNAYYT